MQAELLDATKPLYSPKNRSILVVISTLLVVGYLVVLVSIRMDSVKILTLYVMTACMMYLIITYKNYLNKYEIGIFCFLCVQLVSLAPKIGDMDHSIATSFLLSFRYGVSSRSFAATIIDIITNGGFISKNFVWHFIFCSTVFLSFLLSTYIGLIVQRSKDTVKSFVLFLSLLYLSCFTAPSAYFGPENFGRVEIYAFIFMLVLITVINKPGVRWIIPLLSLFTMSVHLILVFFYIPFIGIMLLYGLLSKEKIQKHSICLFVTTVLIVGVAFILYVLFHGRTFAFQNAHDFSEYLKTKSDLGYSEWAIHMTLFAKLQEHLDNWHNRVVLKFNGNLSVLINIPLVALFVTFWINCFLQERKRTMKLFFSLPVLMLLCQAIAFFIFYDFGRWLIMILNVQFLLVFYLLYIQNAAVLSMAQKITPHIKRHWFIIVLICLLMAFLGTVSYIDPPDRIIRIARGLVMVLKKIW